MTILKTVLHPKSLNHSLDNKKYKSLKSKIQFTGAVGSVVSIVTYTISVITTGAMITAFGGSVAQN